MNHEAERGRIASLVARGMSMEYAIKQVRHENLLASFDLLPCPFCYGPAELDNCFDGHGELLKSEYLAQCTQCGGKLDNCRISPELAAKDWNTRRKITAKSFAGDISNGLIHAADDHPCCKATLHAAANLIIQMELALHTLSQPLGRSDYTVAKLDEIVRKIAGDALNSLHNT